MSDTLQIFGKTYEGVTGLVAKDSRGVDVVYGYNEKLIKNWIQHDSSVKTITWPDGLEKIGFGAFAYCTSFDVSSLPSTVTYIDQYAFSNCYGLSISSLPSGVTTIDQYAFQNCYNIQLTSLPSGLSGRLPYMVFNCCKKISISVLPSGVTRIGNYAFQGCSGITSISSDGAIEELSPYAFNGINNYPMNIKRVSFPNMVASSLSYVFGSTSTTNACSLLEFADIGSTKTIGTNAFANCYALQTLILRRSGAICSLSDISAFLNTPMRGYNSLTGTVYVPSSLISSY